MMIGCCEGVFKVGVETVSSERVLRVGIEKGS